ncbi:hypothetical protein GQX74_005534 [Glossina fuscipes]|nr:hypothetical protein GQX74_005534 [Glossina fuscipes]
MRAIFISYTAFLLLVVVAIDGKTIVQKDEPQDVADVGEPKSDQSERKARFFAQGYLGASGSGYSSGSGSFGSNSGLGGQGVYGGQSSHGGLAGYGGQGGFGLQSGSAGYGLSGFGQIGQGQSGHGQSGYGQSGQGQTNQGTYGGQGYYGGQNLGLGAYGVQGTYQDNYARPTGLVGLSGQSNYNSQGQVPSNAGSGSFGWSLGGRPQSNWNLGGGYWDRSSTQATNLRLYSLRFFSSLKKRIICFSGFNLKYFLNSNGAVTSRSENVFYLSEPGDKPEGEGVWTTTKLISAERRLLDTQQQQQPKGECPLYLLKRGKRK